MYYLPAFLRRHPVSKYCPVDLGGDEVYVYVFEGSVWGGDIR